MGRRRRSSSRSWRRRIDGCDGSSDGSTAGKEVMQRSTSTDSSSLVGSQMDIGECCLE